MLAPSTEFPYEQIITHCQSVSPEEACGLVVLFKGKYKYIPCTNISGNPTQEFCLSPTEYAEAEDTGEIVTIVHSHVKEPSAPSPTDIASQQRSGVDWLIVGIDNGLTNDVTWLKSDKKELPLYARKYLWHVQDCGSFIRDFYRQEFNIAIKDFYRPEKFWERGIEIYLDCYREAGFNEIEARDLSYGDVILMALGTHITTHGAIYIGNNQIAHHMNGRLSCREVYGNFYRDRTTRFLRHKDMLNAKNN